MHNIKMCRVQESRGGRMPFKKIRNTAHSTGKTVEGSGESATVQAGMKRKTTGDCSEETKRPKGGCC